jgi:sporulation protein YlmC with PRC-barrel domain
MGAEAKAAPTPATACLNDLRAFSGKMQQEGYWLGGSAYGYGYPMGEYGYGYGYPMGNDRAGHEGGYHNTRPGYEVRNLMIAANILAQNGQQQACEQVLDTTRTIYQTYATALHRGGSGVAEGQTWQKQQIAAAVPVTDNTTSARLGQLIDSDVRNAQDNALGSVHDLITDPKTGKIAYLIIGRGGLFGIDEKFVPVPWHDFKLTQNVNIVVLDTSKATMGEAPQVTQAQFAAPGQFEVHSREVDTFWKAHAVGKVTN